MQDLGRFVYVAFVVDVFVHRRLHGSLGWLTPVEYEQDHYPQPRAATRIGAAENP
jgi:transposase InsO family protein